MSWLPPQSHVQALPGSQVVASSTSFYDLLNESLTQLCFHLYCLSPQNLALPSYSFLYFFTVSWDPDNTKSWWGPTVWPIIYTYLSSYSEFKLSSLKHGALIPWVASSVLQKNVLHSVFKTVPALTFKTCPSQFHHWTDFLNLSPTDSSLPVKNQPVTQGLAQTTSLVAFPQAAVNMGQHLQQLPCTRALPSEFRESPWHHCQCIVN